jgi:putative DNA primase/helicase
MITLKFDQSLDIATARSRNAATWKNRKISWAELVNKLSNTHRTPEKYAEYLQEKKPRQDEIKDVGGFVGGYLTGGKRRKGHVLHRQIVCLDIDFAKSNTFDDFTMLYDCAGAIYTTHKHGPEMQRYRLVIPLDRPVFAEEYTAIGRRIAGDLGIEYFDNSTFEPERLMYWPSTSKDGEFYFDYQDGEFLSAAKVLGRYVDWRDVSAWPVSDHFSKAVSNAIKKQGDPLDKPGLIGTYCRCYTIHEAIEKFLQDIYEATDIEDRYTFKGGSTSGGLVIYDDKFAYSHHGTDPAGGKLSNAFDLCRIHLFGLKDEDVEPETPINKKPSFVAMSDFAIKQPEVKKLVGSEKIAGAMEDFENELSKDTKESDPEDLEPVKTDWLEKMDVSRSGAFLSTINNIVLILQNDPKLKGRLAFDCFEQREIALKSLPWRSIKENKYLTDADDAAFRHYFERVYGIGSASKIQDGLNIVVHENTFHPVRDYLKALKWGGTERIDTMLIDYLGAADTPYTRAVSRKMMAAAVARVYEPGIKFDQMTALVGPQGKKKSMLIDKIGGKWFSDSIYTMQGKEAFEALQGVWLCEVAELSAMKNSEVEQVKHFVAKRTDRYRVAFGHRVENFPRQCVFWATTNKWNFLKDDKNRRFWPVPIHVLQPLYDVAQMSDKVIGQLWAEAVQIWEKGEALYLTGDLLADAEAMQENHKQVDDRAGIIRKYLETLLPDNWDEMNVYDRRAFLQGDETLAIGTNKRDRVCIAEIWAEVFNGQNKELNKRTAFELHEIMEGFPDWGRLDNKKRFGIYGVQRGYFLTEKYSDFAVKKVAF